MALFYLCHLFYVELKSLFLYADIYGRIYLLVFLVPSFSLAEFNRTSIHPLFSLLLHFQHL